MADRGTGRRCREPYRRTERITRKFEGFLPMRLQAESAPDSRHRSLRKADLPSHRARTPVLCSRRYRLRRLRDHGIDTCVLDRSGCTRTRRVEQTIEPVRHVARSPLRDSLLSNPQFHRDRLVVDAPGAGQHDPRSHCQRLRRLTTHRQARELIALRFAQHKFLLGSPAHCRLVVSVLHQTLLHAATYSMNF